MDSVDMALGTNMSPIKMMAVNYQDDTAEVEKPPKLIQIKSTT